MQPHQNKKNLFYDTLNTIKESALKLFPSTCCSNNEIEFEFTILSIFNHHVMNSQTMPAYRYVAINHSYIFLAANFFISCPE